MKKQVTKDSLEKMIALQKGYIDAGDQQNRQTIDELGTQVAQNSQAIEGIGTEFGEIINEFETRITQNTQTIKGLGTQVARNTQTIDVLTGYNSVVGEFPYGTTDYVAKDVWGDPKHLLKLFYPVLIDTTDNAGQKAKAKKLRRNNLLRFEDGSFAPVVGITQAMYDECMTHDLYVFKDEAYKRVYRAGEYDAVAQWEADKALLVAGQELPALYLGEGGAYTPVSHRLRPWETTETKYTIGVANIIDLYLLDNQQGVSGKNFKGIFFNGNNPYDGIEISKWKLPPTAISPCPITTIKDGDLIKARNFFYLYQGITNCRSDKGLLEVNPFYEADRTYPRTNDVSQVTNMNYARNNNADWRISYPFAEGGYFAWNVFITALELAAKTRYIHAANLFGSGISSNDGTNADNFFTSGGIRFREADVEGAAWNYKTWSSMSTPLGYNNVGSGNTMASLLTGLAPKEQCMESQLAASMAVELGINPTMADAIETPNTFEFYGNTYYYMNVPGFDGLQEGDMNTRLYKFQKANIDAFNNHGEPQTWDMEIVTRMSLFNGVNLCGDISAYNGGGLEMVGTYLGKITGNEIKLYVEPDQTKWLRVINTLISSGSKFEFEGSYKLMAVTNLGDSYTLTREGYTPWKIANASSMAQGECYYQEDKAFWESNTNRIRIRQLFRGNSIDSYCSPRALDATSNAQYTGQVCSGSVQVLVEFV